jgi:hypothetical protein
VSEQPTLAERIEAGVGILTRTDLRELGWQRRGIDALFAGVPLVAIPGYTRPVIRVSDYLAYLDEHTYDDRRGDRVRP